MSEALILNYYKPHPPPMGWRSEIAGAFAVGTVVGCVLVGFIAAVLDGFLYRGHFDVCPVIGGGALAGVILGMFGGVVLAIAMSIRVRILRGQFQTRQGRAATWAGVLYPVSAVVVLITAGLSGLLNKLEGELSVALIVLIAYPVGAACVLVRPWGESIRAGKPPAPLPVIEIEAAPDEADKRNS